MITLKNINVQFDTLKVLSDVSLEINQGEITSILGPSGSGKTTLLRCIAGLNTKFNGKITVDNKEQRHYLEDTRIAVVNQGYSSFPWLSVKENILVAKKRSSSNNLDVDQILGAIGLNGFEDYYPSQLSGGMQQRVAIGRAIIQDTDILVFDEPFGALDYQTRLQLQLLIKRIKNDFGKTIVFVTHDIEEAIFISDKVVVLSKTPSIIVEEININEEIKSSLDNKVRYIPEFIELRSSIENVFQNLDSREDLRNIFSSKSYDKLAQLDCWNTFLTNECRKFYKELSTPTQQQITLNLLNSQESNAIIIGTLLHPETTNEDINNKLKNLLSQTKDYKQTYFLTHAITRLKNLNIDEKLSVKKLVYNNIEDHIYFDRKYYTADNVYGDKVVLNLLNSHFFGHKVESYLQNKGWLLLISSLAHSNTEEVLDFLSEFINHEDAMTKETAVELIEKIKNNEIDFNKIRQ